jgi:hypothetical protein
MSGCLLAYASFSMTWVISDQGCTPLCIDAPHRHRHRRTFGAPEMALLHWANNFPQLQNFVTAVMCTVCCLVWLVVFGESTLATLLERGTRVVKRLEVVSEASTPSIPVLVSVESFRRACALSSRPPEQSFALQSARNGRFSLAARVQQKCTIQTASVYRC